MSPASNDKDINAFIQNMEQLKLNYNARKKFDKVVQHCLNNNE